ncbi:MAG: hypothetical protein D9V47_04250 [Clostridia bacterium]|nr:MAG: hypothetical protein D9V47_04250 [Clostridia bacterium]
MASWIEALEQRFGRRPPPVSRVSTPPTLRPGTRVIVVGGGIAGSSFARQLLLLTNRENLPVRVYLINSTNCNYCGGLITDLALQTMQELLALDVPAHLVLKQVKSCIYVNQKGYVPVQLNQPLTATLRTSRFGVEGFDDSLKDRILEGLPGEYAEQLTSIEPTIVKQVLREGSGWRVVLSKRNPDKSFMEIEGDVLIMASGFRALNRPMMTGFQAAGGYVPPPTMEASVTEVDTSQAEFNYIGSRMFILDNLVPGAMLAFIPKGENWLTVTSLGHRMSKEDIDYLFTHPSLREFIYFPQASAHLRCHTICPASVYTGASPGFYGDGWAAVGDLTGYGRVLKDGYFASFLGTRLAAETIVYHGTSRSDFNRYYHAPLRFFAGDNRVGMTLFNWDNRLQQYPWFRHFLVKAARAEARRRPYGSSLHAAFRSLATGELSYRLTATLFVAGLLGHAALHPWDLAAGRGEDRVGAG